MMSIHFISAEFLGCCIVFRKLHFSYWGVALIGSPLGIEIVGMVCLLGFVLDRDFILPPTVGQSHVSEYFRLLTGQIEVPQGVDSSSQAPVQTMSHGRIAIAPGGAKNELRDDALRRMSLQQYRWIAEFEISSGRAVSIIGAASDDWVKEGFQGLSVQFDFSPRPLLDFFQSLKIYDRLYTHDSGPMHLAILAGVPVVAFFGPTRPDEKVPMNDPKVRVIDRESLLAFQPCYDGKNYAVCSQNKCLEWSKDEFLGLLF